MKPTDFLRDQISFFLRNAQSDDFTERILTDRHNVTNQRRMGRIGGFVVFLSVVVSTLIGLHYYLWTRLVRDSLLPSPWRVLASAVLILAAASVPAAFVLRRASPTALRLIVWPALIWIGLMFLLVQIWPFGGLVRLQQGFLAGLGRHQDTLIYVSRGTGCWGPPMRLFAPAEITQIVLRATA